jgi:hypothetical protein
MLQGYAEHLRETISGLRDRADQSQYETSESLLQAALGPDEYRRLCEKGAQLTWDEALALAASALQE